MVVINSSLVYSDVGTAIDIDVVMKSLLYYLFHSCNSRPRVRGNSGRDRLVSELTGLRQPREARVGCSNQCGDESVEFQTKPVQITILPFYSLLCHPNPKISLRYV